MKRKEEILFSCAKVVIIYMILRKKPEKKLRKLVKNGWKKTKKDFS